MRLSRFAAFPLLALLSVPAFALKIERILQTRVAGQPPVSIEVVSERAFVRFSSGTSTNEKAASLAGLNAQVNQEFPRLGWTAVGLPAGMSVSAALDQLRHLPYVLDAQPDHVHRVSRSPSDPLVGSQYALARVDAFGAWEYETGSSSRVTIAVVDVGISSTQPDLSSKMVGLAHQFCNPGANKVSLADDQACITVISTTPACNHATHVAGVAAASTDNGVQVAGMSWGAQLLSLKVFRNDDCNMDCTDAGGSCATDDAAIAKAIGVVTGMQNTALYGKMVINLSLGGTGGCEATLLQPAITAALAAGVVVVAAAGNDGGYVNSPGNCAGVIPMGATDSGNNVAFFSSRGAELASNGLVAPGVAVLTTDVGGNTTSATGTSFASPMGAGLAALLLSAKPTLMPAQVQTYMRAGAEDIGQPSSVQGAGRMNAYRSMRLAVKGTLAGFDGEQKPIAFPNPFRVSRDPRVSFAIPPSLQGSGLNIKVYTLDGQLVRELASSVLVWDGKNADGNLVASGTYVFQVSSSGGAGRGRMAVIR